MIYGFQLACLDRLRRVFANGLWGLKPLGGVRSFLANDVVAKWCELGGRLGRRMDSRAMSARGAVRLGPADLLVAELGGCGIEPHDANSRPLWPLRRQPF